MLLEQGLQINGEYMVFFVTKFFEHLNENYGIKSHGGISILNLSHAKQKRSLAICMDIDTKRAIIYKEHLPRKIKRYLIKVLGRNGVKITFKRNLYES